jgi:hypothetical protein
MRTRSNEFTPGPYSALSLHAPEDAQQHRGRQFPLHRRAHHARHHPPVQRPAPTRTTPSCVAVLAATRRHPQHPPPAPPLSALISLNESYTVCRFQANGGARCPHVGHGWSLRAPAARRVVLGNAPAPLRATPLASDPAARPNPNWRPGTSHQPPRPGSCTYPRGGSSPTMKCSLRKTVSIASGAGHCPSRFNAATARPIRASSTVGAEAGDTRRAPDTKVPALPGLWSFAAPLAPSCSPPPPPSAAALP